MEFQRSGSGINLIETSSIASTNFGFYCDRIEKDAQALANEYECEIETWQRDDSDERTSHTGIVVQLIK